MKVHLTISFLLLAITLVQAAKAQSSTQLVPPSPDETARIERLVQLGHLWGQVKYFHPYLAYKDIDWDQAVIEHLPTIEKAKTKEELSSALQNLLNVLDDPATRVVEEKANRHVSHSDLVDDLHPRGYLTDDSILVVEITDYVDLLDWRSAPKRLEDALEGSEAARSIVFDLRNLRGSGDTEEDWYYGDYTFAQSEIDRRLSTEPLKGPSTRSRIHYGYELDDNEGGEVYFSGFLNRDGTQFAGEAEQMIPVTFLINNASFIPELALILQQKGKAAILSEGPITDYSWVYTLPVRFERGVEVRVRVNERVFSNGVTGFEPDQILPLKADKHEALKRAIAFARTFQPGQPEEKSIDYPTNILEIKKMSGALHFPSRAHRIVAVYKIWNVVEHFFVYKHLMDRPWKPALAEYIPQFEAASDSLEYGLTAARMITRLQDGHARVLGAALTKYFGTATAPLFVRFVEGIPLVTGFRDDSLAIASGIRIGDEIVEVDGIPVERRIEQLSPYLAASNPWTHKRYIAWRLLYGPEEKEAKIKVRSSNGHIREVSLPRDRRFARIPSRKGDVVRMIDDNIGYVDLDRLNSDIDQVFAELRDTRGIVFDMRGYPSFGAGSIGPRVGLTDSEMPFLVGRQPVVEPSGGDIRTQTYRELRQFFPKVEVPWVYDRPIVLLIDERTQSTAESVGLEFAAAKNTVFIGSETAGANGNVTYATLPGGLRIGFSGTEVHFPNGDQLQRKGIQPDIRVLPTIEGIRSGRDEVLEAAVKHLNENADDD